MLRNHRPLRFGPGLPPPNRLGQLWTTEYPWAVEFFPNEFVNVTVTSIDSVSFKDTLESFIDDKPMALDFEWHQNKEISVIQICSSVGALIIQRDVRSGPSEILQQFFETNSFFSKYTKHDLKKMREIFGRHFNVNIEDIEITRIRAHNHSPNFLEIIKTFAGSPTGDFLVKHLAYSDWSKNPLQVNQVLYAAFHVVGLYKAYKNFPEPITNFICEDMNCPTPIQYIPGIERFDVSDEIEYLIVFPLNGKSDEEIMKILAGKPSFLRSIHHPKSLGDKVIAEVSNIKGYQSYLENYGMKCGHLDISNFL
ncbi:hypothetical protein TRFO_04357 [Tritrichomonas foetus]|uniref:3'-5' exonuclease domain-containing protein n=1 Tax=Tritrichomonas foetus TaxID=1144522 RepID=A0A1J4KH75_9EUKA|nr:hypothetical protein TRFO_04357 [Tritrichomonas foetus]|eukprot:OHT10312.1 hypothetical protein TRFO_04357 [Tritrichomonas foetus]